MVSPKTSANDWFVYFNSANNVYDYFRRSDNNADWSTLLLSRMLNVRTEDIDSLWFKLGKLEQDQYLRDGCACPSVRRMH